MKLKLFLMTFVVSISCLGAVSFACAADVKVNWGDLSKFTDVNAGRDHRDVFREQLVKALNEVFSLEAKKLSSAYVLELSITDLDLAGEVQPFSSSPFQQLRVMRPAHWPTMHLEYSLKNERGEVVKNGKEVLRDMDYLHHLRPSSSANTFQYEEKMIQDWFKEKLKSGAFPKAQ